MKQKKKYYNLFLVKKHESKRFGSLKSKHSIGIIHYKLTVSGHYNVECYWQSVTHNIGSTYLLKTGLKAVYLMPVNQSIKSI